MGRHYVMTFEDAQAATGVSGWEFDGYSTVAAWLGENFAVNKESMLEYSQSIGSGTYGGKDKYGVYSYKFSKEGGTGKDLYDAIGVYFYDDGKNVAYNVMDNNSSEWFHFTYDNRQTGWTAVTSVPEPTSGLLMLMGGMLLGLRRKRA